MGRTLISAVRSAKPKAVPHFSKTAWKTLEAMPHTTRKTEEGRICQQSLPVAAPAEQGEHAQATKKSGGWLGDDSKSQSDLTSEARRRFSIE